MSKGSIITLVVLVVLVLGGVLVWKQQQRSSAERECRETAVALLESSVGLSKHREYVRGLMDRHHSSAFASAYDSGGLFAPSEFDEQSYVEHLWRLIRQSAESDGRQDVIEAMPAIGER